MQDSAHATLRGTFNCVLGLVQWYLPTICQSDVVHGPLPFTEVDSTNIISLWGVVSKHQQRLAISLKGRTEIIILSHISSIILQGNWTKFSVGVPIPAIQCGPSIHAAEISCPLTLRRLSSREAKSLSQGSQAGLTAVNSR